MKRGSNKFFNADFVKRFSFCILSLMLLCACAKDSIYSISFKDNEVILRPGEAVRLAPEVQPGGASVTDLSWKSSNPDAVTVDAEGVVTGVAFGESVITASSTSQSAECTVIVTIPAENISLAEGEVFLRVGDSHAFEVTVTPADAERDFVWKSSAPEYVTVSADGVATAVADGEAEITVTAARGTLSTTCLVKSISYDPDDYVDEWGINHGKGIVIGGVTWAPVNCGYHETDYPYGKLYQWGRKDGNGYTADEDGLGEDDATIPSIRYALAYGEVPESDVFYTSADYVVGQWMESDDNGQIAFPESLKWMSLSSSDVFSENPGLGNPCPEGWRVPTREDFRSLGLGTSNFESSSTWHPRGTEATPHGQAGRYFGENHAEATASDPKGCLWLPAAGSRHADTGVSYYRNLFGEYWMDTREEIYYSGEFYIAGNEASDTFVYSAMSNGLSLRCVKE